MSEENRKNHGKKDLKPYGDVDGEKQYRIAAAVMIGGNSSRMGRPKENILLPGENITFLDKVCREVDGCEALDRPGRYLSVRRGQQVSREGYTPVWDQFHGIGPMGGVFSVLEKAGEDHFDAVLFLACDMVRMESVELTDICEVYQGEDILFVKTENHFVQPFGSIYKTSITEVIRQKIDHGDYRIRSLLDSGCDIRIFQSERPYMYENINEIGDLSRIQEKRKK